MFKKITTVTVDAEVCSMISNVTIGWSKLIKQKITL